MFCYTLYAIGILYIFIIPLLFRWLRPRPVHSKSKHNISKNSEEPRPIGILTQCRQFMSHSFPSLLSGFTAKSCPKVNIACKRLTEDSEKTS